MVTADTFAGVPGVASYRVLNVTGGDVTISGVTIRHGKGGDAGGILLQVGTLAIVNSTISGNAANDAGGLLNIRGTLAITNSRISDNTATINGGGISNLEGNPNDHEQHDQRQQGWYQRRQHTYYTTLTLARSP